MLDDRGDSARQTGVSMSTIRITDESTREDLEEALTHLAHAAAREMPVVGTDAMPTPWDRRHAAIDELLDRMGE